MKVYWGKSFIDKNGKQAPGAELNETEVKDFKGLFKTFFEKPQQGNKADAYITIAKQVEITKGDPSKANYKAFDHFHRNDVSQLTAQVIAYDGDASKDDPESCIPVSEIKSALDSLRYRYILYTTHSHSTTRNRWRLFIPCLINHKNKHKPTVRRLFDELEKLCPNLAWTNESKTWCQPWFIALRDDPNDGLYESYFNDDGRDFTAVDAPISNSSTSPTSTLPSTSESEMLQVLLSGSHPLHKTINNYIYGRLKDGMQPGALKSHLHAFTLGWDLSDSRLQSRKNDIDRLVDTATIKFSNDSSTHWNTEHSETDRIFTKYPSLGGRMEEFVQECMSWMIFPNRQIAVTAVRGLISAMGARTYTLPDGKGINLTALITGRSTIGKSNIKKFFIWALDNIALTKFSQFYLGAQHYTSPKNLVDDLREKTALYSVRTESGQSDKSSAGDMPRVMNYELEFATEGGKGGYVSRGGQNRTRNGDETLPALYSPPVTTIRESVAQIQNDADILNQSTVAGVTGRRSVILIDPIKAQRNYDRPEKPSKKLKELILNLHKLASDTAKKDCTVPMPEDAWIILKSEDSEFLKARENDWLTQENKAAANGENLSSTFFGRLYERVPAFAGILAIAENPLMPIITNEQYKIAEQCLYNEFQALNEQNSDGSLNGYWGVLEQKIVNIFKGDMMKYTTRYDKSLRDIAKKELKEGAIELTSLNRILQHTEAFITAKSQKGFSREFEDRCLALNIRKMRDHEVKEKFGHKRCVYVRI